MPGTHPVVRSFLSHFYPAFLTPSLSLPLFLADSLSLSLANCTSPLLRPSPFILATPSPSPSPSLPPPCFFHLATARTRNEPQDWEQDFLTTSCVHVCAPSTLRGETYPPRMSLGLCDSTTRGSTMGSRRERRFREMSKCPLIGSSLSIVSHDPNPPVAEGFSGYFTNFGKVIWDFYVGQSDTQHEFPFRAVNILIPTDVPLLSDRHFTFLLSVDYCFELRF